jgi:hypothetical protein
MINNTPYIKAEVSNAIIKGTSGFTECYIIAVTTLLNRPHLFTVHTVDGAIYSRLPIWALRHDNKSPLVPGMPEYTDLHILDDFGTICENVQLTQLTYLKDYEADVIGEDWVGRYLFSIEPCHGAFSEDPEQSKLLHFLELDCGFFGIFPNNKLKFMDNYFTKPSTDAYIRNTKYFTL